MQKKKWWMLGTEASYFARCISNAHMRHHILRLAWTYTMQSIQSSHLQHCTHKEKFVAAVVKTSDLTQCNVCVL
jgi:hypothetical protein